MAERCDMRVLVTGGQDYPDSTSAHVSSQHLMYPGGQDEREGHLCNDVVQVMRSLVQRSRPRDWHFTTFASMAASILAQ